MSNEFTTALERELQRLRAELQQDPRYKRMTQIEQLLAEYRGEPAPAEAVIAPPSAVQEPRVVHLTAAGITVGSSRLHGRARLIKVSKAARVRLELEELLQARGSAHRKVMLNHLIDKNLMGREKNPMASLAAYLSAWKKDFVSDGKGNFSLKKTTERGSNEPLLAH
jgi:hypothetical protein